jgi:pyridoxamine 5'-phosphate oxidase
MQELVTLDESVAGPEPWTLFKRWYDDAQCAQLDDPEAMTLATATNEGVPSARIVLLRGFDERGFVFFTNYQSRKALELDQNPHAALVFLWPPLKRQVRVEGSVEKVSVAESDAYFAQRPLGHKLSAIASPQSRVVSGRRELEARMADLTAQYAGREVARPDHWGGYRVRPHMIEFWLGRLDRLHDRLRYTRQAEGSWLLERLAP